jgi:hypothetical protein
MLKTTFLWLTLLLLSAGAITAQQSSYLDGRWTVKLMHRLEGENKAPIPNNGFWEAMGTNHLEVNYGFARYIEAGAHVGLSRSLVFSPPGTAPSAGEAFQYVFGANLNLHLLPLFVKSPDFRFDLYALGRLSSDYRKVFDAEPRRHQGIAGFGVGGAFYLTKHIGLNVEYVRNSFTGADNRALRSAWGTYHIGLAYKFR